MTDEYIPLWKGILLFLILPLVIVGGIWAFCDWLGIGIQWVAVVVIVGMGVAGLVKKWRDR